MPVLPLTNQRIHDGLHHIRVLAAAMETISFPTTDILTITTDIYVGHELTAPVIALFHQAGWCRGEYQRIARLYPAGQSHFWRAVTQEK